MTRAGRSPPFSSETGPAAHRGWWAALLLAALACSWACGSDARGGDTCRKIEGARCEQADRCGGLVVGGDIESCKRFYDVQCGRGVQDTVKEPSNSELDVCLGAIRSSCDVARAPERSTACAFLVGNVQDSGAAGSDADSDGASDGAGDTRDGADEG